MFFERKKKGETYKLIVHVIGDGSSRMLLLDI